MSRLADYAVITLGAALALAALYWLLRHPCQVGEFVDTILLGAVLFGGAFWIMARFKLC